MFIKITKSVVHLGYGYRIGFTGDVPEDVGREIVRMGRAVLLPSPKVLKEEVPEEEKETEPKVIKAVVTKTRKRR